MGAYGAPVSLVPETAIVPTPQTDMNSQLTTDFDPLDDLWHIYYQGIPLDGGYVTKFAADAVRDLLPSLEHPQTLQLSNSEGILSVPDAAARFGVSTSNLYYHIATGSLTSHTKRGPRGRAVKAVSVADVERLYRRSSRVDLSLKIA